MIQESSFPSDLTLQGLVSQLHDLFDKDSDRPTQEQIEEVCEILYAASLLKEEGRVVRARVMIAPPGAFAQTEEPEDGIHVVRFANAHRFSAHEIKRLSPAASFYHSIVAIWPDKGKGFFIWGVINTGPRWLNMVAGGRKPPGTEIDYPIMHVRDPGWLLFYHNYRLLAEWRGREFHGPRLDVFLSPLLRARFAHMRQSLVAEVMDCCLPSSLSFDSYADLTFLISQQFVKRIINLVRSAGHGGSVVILPDGNVGMDAANRWIDCKYSARPDDAALRYRRLLQAILRRVGQLCPENASPEEAWHLFRNSKDPELDRLEEAYFELARFFSDLMQVDGVLVLDQRVGVIGFGGEIRVDSNVFQVGQAHDLEGTQITNWNVQNDGTRHRSVYRLCSVEPSIIGFVISQDSHVRMIANVEGSVTFWSHTVV